MKTINQRLFEVFALLNLSTYRVGKDIETASSVLSNIKAENNRPSADFLIKVLTQYPQISAEYLMRGEGEPLRKEFGTNQGEEHKGTPPKRSTTTDTLAQRLDEVLLRLEKAEKRLADAGL